MAPQKHCLNTHHIRQLHKWFFITMTFTKAEQTYWRNLHRNIPKHMGRNRFVSISWKVASTDMYSCFEFHAKVLIAFSTYTNYCFTQFCWLFVNIWNVKAPNNSRFCSNARHLLIDSLCCTAILWTKTRSMDWQKYPQYMINVLLMYFNTDFFFSFLFSGTNSPFYQ